MRTHVDLFSGIGGFSLACEWAGVQTIAFAETNPYACKVLNKHWPEIPNYGDVKQFPALSAWLLTGGVPCQPASSAGRRRGAADDRWLWPQSIEVVRRGSYQWLLFENPTGILSLNHGLEFERVCTALEDEDYEVQPLIIPACAINAKHRRDRVWIIAHSKHLRWPANQVTEGAGARTDPSQGESGAEQFTGPGGSQARAASLAAIEPFTTDAPSNGSAARISRSQSWQEGQSGVVINSSNARHSSISRLPHWAGGTLGQPGPLTEFERPGGREIERDFRGVAHGVSKRVDRLRCLGNAIVPQVAYELIKRMIESEGVSDE